MARILLVDDEEGVRGFLKRGLELDGHEVAVAADGAEGLEALDRAAGAFDLLISDIRMPVMDGIELALAAKQAHPELTILMMTGYAELEDRARGLEAVAADLLTKPFSLGDLRDAVRRTLG